MTDCATVSVVYLVKLERSVRFEQFPIPFTAVPTTLSALNHLCTEDLSEISSLKLLP